MNRQEWPYYPYTVQIEAVQGCNRRCRFCGTAGMERKFYFADIKTVQHTCRLIRDAGLNCRILLAGHGEPTLHPQIAQIIAEIRKHLPENTIHLFTNGTVIEKHPEMVVELFNAGLNDLVFDEYSDHRVGEFVRNDPICRSFRVVEQGRGVPLMCEKKPGQKRICIVPPIDIVGKNTANRKLINHCGAGMKPLRAPLEAKCGNLFRDLFVRWDGNIAICCNDFRGEYYVTNIMQCGTLREAYFHRRLESARRFSMINNRKAVHPCDVCNDKPIRPGLLPDRSGKVKLDKPTAEDYRIVMENREPLAKVVRREWEAGGRKT